MRLVMPHGGYGLGNDLIPWAKGFILSRELGAKLLHPAWGNNPRKYWQYFGTSRVDWQLYRVLVRTLPHYAFSEQLFRDLGESDFEKASRRFAEKFGLYQKKAFVVTITGHWAAFAGIETARHFVRETLYSTKYTRQNLHSIEKLKDPKKLSIAVHVRGGDFSPPSLELNYRSLLNRTVPLGWFVNTCCALVEALGENNLQFLVASDGPGEKLADLLERFPCIFMSALAHSDISDLIAMSTSDLLICSPSTYSIWASFLSDEPYVWFAPQLNSTAGGMQHDWIRSLGMLSAHDAGERPEFVWPRGVPVGMDGQLPSNLVEYLREKHLMKDRTTDIVRGGSV